ncbi:hypothetical protein F0U59_04765 [Archangium gephyra]|nr:hypothetical protein F0U59_04765 [Archangium gephyra]
MGGSEEKQGTLGNPFCVSVAERGNRVLYGFTLRLGPPEPPQPSRGIPTGPEATKKTPKLLQALKRRSREAGGRK